MEASRVQKFFLLIFWAAGRKMDMRFLPTYIMFQAYRFKIFSLVLVCQFWLAAYGQTPDATFAGSLNRDATGASLSDASDATAANFTAQDASRDATQNISAEQVILNRQKLREVRLDSTPSIWRKIDTLYELPYSFVCCLE